MTIARAGDGFLVGQDDVETLAERGNEQRRRLVARHVHHDRMRNGVVRHELERLGRRGLGTAQRREQGAAVLLARQLEKATIREAALIEDVAGAIEYPHDAHRWSAG